MDFGAFGFAVDDTSIATKKLEKITQQYANKAGKKPTEYHTLQAKLNAAKQIMLGSFDNAVEMLSAADAASAAAEHATYHSSAAAAPSGLAAALLPRQHQSMMQQQRRQRRQKVRLTLRRQMR